MCRLIPLVIELFLERLELPLACPLLEFLRPLKRRSAGNRGLVRDHVVKGRPRRLSVCLADAL